MKSVLSPATYPSLATTQQHHGQQYPQQHKRQSSNPFVMFNESNVPNYSHLNDHDDDIDDDDEEFAEMNDRAAARHPNGSNWKALSFSSMFLESGIASSISTSFNIMKGIMGVGILTLPWAMSNIGLLPSLILMLLSFLLSYICWILLCLLCEKYRVYAYRDVGFILFGDRFARSLDLILLVFLYFVCILYVVFLSEFVIDGLTEFDISINTHIGFSNLHTLTSFGEFVQTKFFIITVTVFAILFPLSLLRRLDSLKYSSFLGIIGCFYTIGLVVFIFFDATDKRGYYLSPNVQFFGNFHSANGEHSYIWYWLSSFSVFVASFNTHFNCPALYGELKEKTPRKYITISSLSFVMVLIVNLLLGICGYFTFGTSLDENILDTLNHGLVVGIARFIMTLTIIGTYPLLFWNIKVSIKNLVLYKNVSNEQHTKIKKIKRKYTCGCSKISIYFLVTLVIWIVAIVAFDVAVMISFLQSLLGNAIVFIFPAVFYLQMLKNEAKKSVPSKTNMTKVFCATVLCYILVIFGTVSVIGGCIASIMFWVGYIQ